MRAHRQLVPGFWGKGARLGRAVLLLGAVLLLPSLEAQSGNRTEDRLLAEFIYRFARYTFWPEGARPTEGEPLVFAIVGAIPEQQTAYQALAGRAIRDYPVKVVFEEEGWSLPLEPPWPHVLFDVQSDVLKPERTDLNPGEAPVLTIVRHPRYLVEGDGVLCIYRRGDRLMFDGSLTNAARAGLTLSSRMLALARQVHSEEE
ncbi:MAG: YfiR family protein [Opitutales bacterium]